MLQENRDLTGKRNNAKMVIGYDLGRQFSQVSYYAVGDADPCTVSPVAGTEQYNIPTVLCKRVGVSQWYYGKEALKNQGEEGILVDHLLEKALQGEEVLVEETGGTAYPVYQTKPCNSQYAGFLKPCGGFHVYGGGADPAYGRGVGEGGIRTAA